MKKSITQWIAAVVFVFTVFPGYTHLPPPKTLDAGCYIVVAAYHANQESFAQRYIAQLKNNNISADYGYDVDRNFIYVYIDSKTDLQESIDRMMQARAEGNFKDAWVRVMKFNTPQTVVVNHEKKNESVIAKTEPVLVNSKAGTGNEPASQAEVPVAVETVAAPPIQSAILSVDTEVIPNSIPAPIFRPQTLKTTPVFLSIANPRNGKLVESDVEVIDTDMNRLITKVKGNTYVNLPDPKNKSGRLTLIASPFGYRKVQNVINFRETEADTLQPYVDMVGNFYLVKFDMVRYHPGDIVTLYNVYFYNDAAVMLPESKYELNNLLLMMKDNPGYRIKLHGHTNGNHRGKIITMGKSKDFFAINEEVEETIGSAKELSGARAGVIRDWLISEGIDPSRIEMKAWGGDRMIHDKHSQHARKNVRVEVEVLAE